MNYFLFFCTWVDCVWINQSTLLALRSLGICVCNDTKFIDFLLSEALRILVELKSKTKLKIENFDENTQNTKLWASIAKRLIVVQQLRKTIFIYVSREIRVYHIKFIPLSIYGMLNCVRVRAWVYTCMVLSVLVLSRNHMVVCSFTHTRVPKASGSFLCYLTCEPRHTTSPRRVFVLAQLFAIVFLLQEKKSLFFICVKFLRVSTWFFGCFQVNQKLTNSLDFCNRKYSNNNKCNLHTTL